MNRLPGIAADIAIAAALIGMIFLALDWGLQ